MDIDKVNAGWAALANYRSAHELLHQQPAGTETIRQGHDDLMAVFNAELVALGYDGISEFETDDAELRTAEETAAVRDMVLPAGGPLRFVDISALSLEDRMKLSLTARQLRSDDEIADTVYFWSVIGREQPMVRVTDSAAGDAVAARAAEYGIAAVRVTPNNPAHYHGYSYQNDVGLTYLIKDRFTGKTQAREVVSAVCIRILESLGVDCISLKPGGNNIKAQERKVAGGMAALTAGGYYLATTPITVDLDYDLIAYIFGTADIRTRIITLRELLGDGFTVAGMKQAALAILPQVFSCTVTSEIPTAVEMSGII